MNNEFNLEVSKEIKADIDGKDFNEVYDIIQCYASKDKYTTMMYMYWNTDYPVLRLTKALGYDTDESSYLRSKKIIDSIEHKVTCKKCHSIKDVTVNNRNELGRLRDNKDHYVCKDCSDNKVPKIKTVSGRENLGITYDEYLETDHWHKVRTRTLGMAGFKCQLCSSKLNLVVHHNNYANLWNETPKDCVCLCRQCHSNFHNHTQCPK